MVSSTARIRTWFNRQWTRGCSGNGGGGAGSGGGRC